LASMFLVYAGGGSSESPVSSVFSGSRFTAGGGTGLGLSHFEAFFDSFGDTSDAAGARSNTLLADAIEIYRGYSNQAITDSFLRSEFSE